MAKIIATTIKEFQKLESVAKRVFGDELKGVESVESRILGAVGITLKQSFTDLVTYLPKEEKIERVMLRPECNLLEIHLKDCVVLCDLKNEIKFDFIISY